MGWDRVSGSAGGQHLEIAAGRRTVLSHTGTCPWEGKAAVLLFLFHPSEGSALRSAKCVFCCLAFDQQPRENTEDIS